MGSIGRRLDALERGGDRCAVCGWDPHAEVEVVWDIRDPGEAPEPRRPKYCPSCGRPDEIVVGWGDKDLPE